MNYPKKIEDYDFYNTDDTLFNRIIKNYDNFDNMPNIIVYGKNGCGKKSRIYSILSNIADDTIYNKTFLEYNNKIKFFRSEYHIEFNLMHYNLNDKCIIDNYLKDYCDSRNIGFDIPKIVIFFNACLMSKISQYMLRRIIEINHNNVRFIFSVKNINKIIDPLRSRFMLLRIPQPSYNNFKIIIDNYLLKKKIDVDLNDEDYKYIVENGDFNISNVLDSVPLYINGANIIKNYKIVLDEIFNLITTKNYNMKKYYDIRSQIYDLYTDNNNESLMFEYLYKKVLKDKTLNDRKKMDFVKEASTINHKMSIGNKEPLYLECLLNCISILYL